MKTTKSRLLNIVIIGSVAVNLTVIAGLTYIAQVNSKTERALAYLNAPLVIYVPKSVKPEATTLVEASTTKQN